jgi:hypothetical protein
MKKYMNFIFVMGGLMFFLASCQCKTCTKDSEISIQVCKDDVSEQEYNDAVSNLESGGYACK